MIPENIRKVLDDSKEMTIQLHSQLNVTYRCITLLEHICVHMSKCNDLLVKIIENCDLKHNDDTVKLISSVKDEESNAHSWRCKLEKYKNRLNTTITDEIFIKNFVKECDDLIIKCEPMVNDEETENCFISAELSNDEFINNEDDDHYNDRDLIKFNTRKIEKSENPLLNATSEQLNDRKEIKEMFYDKITEHMSDDNSDDDNSDDDNYILDDCDDIELDSDESNNNVESDDWTQTCKRGKNTNKKNNKVKAKRKTHIYYDDTIDEFKDGDKYICKEIDCQFITEEKIEFMKHLNYHVKLKEKESKLICTYNGCNMRFKNKRNRDAHIQRIHMKLRPYTCEWPGCDIAVFSPQELRGHRRIHTKDSNGITVNDEIKKQRKRYQRNDLKNRKYDDEPLNEYKNGDYFVCKESHCDFSTDIKYAFTRHLRNHDTIREREINRICDYDGCGMRFKNKRNRDQHYKRLHLKLRSFPCEWPGCGFELFRLTELRQHMQTHTKEKPHVCDWPSCDFKCSSKWSLTSHRRIHTQEKPYPCNWPECTFRASNNSALSVHKRKHTGEKPYKCEFPGCDKRFATKAGISLHKHKL